MGATAATHPPVARCSAPVRSVCGRRRAMSEQLYVVEMETEGGWRYWSAPMPYSETGDYIAEMESSYGDWFSDCDTYTPDMMEV